jgi:Family of unknown function (DUF6533)
MSNTSDALSVDLVEEVWGITLTHYLSAMGMVLVLYDCLLTLNHEVCTVFSCLCHIIRLTVCSQMRLVWPGALTLAKVLYYINRYLSAIIMIYSSYRQYCDIASWFEH